MLCAKTIQQPTHKFWSNGVSLGLSLRFVWDWYPSFIATALNTFTTIRQPTLFPNKFMINTLMPRQNGRHFADDIFKCIFLNENIWIPIEISLTCVPKGPINNTSDAPCWTTGVTKYAKKASIATTREQSVIVTSQLLVIGSCIDDVIIGQHFESFGAVTG